MRCIFRDCFDQKLSWLLVKSMKLILATLFLSACSKPEPQRGSTPVNNTVAPTPEIEVEGLLQNETDRVATLAGLGKLRSSSLGNDDVEVRVWFGFGLVRAESCQKIRSISKTQRLRPLDANKPQRLVRQKSNLKIFSEDS
jgi:hypothetical protein